MHVVTLLEWLRQKRPSSLWVEDKVYIDTVMPSGISKICGTVCLYISDQTIT